MDTGILGAAYSQFVPRCRSRIHRVHQRRGQSGRIFGTVRDRRASLSGTYTDGFGDGDCNSIRWGGDAYMAGGGAEVCRETSSHREHAAGQSKKLILLVPERREPRQ